MTTPGKASACTGVSNLFSRIGEKWVAQIFACLSARPYRFSALMGQIPGISQQVLTRALKALERDGVVQRTVRNTRPPQTEYALTELGTALSAQVRHLAEWSLANDSEMRAAAMRFDAEQ